MRMQLIKKQLDLLSSTTGIGFLFTNNGLSVSSDAYLDMGSASIMKQQVIPIPEQYSYAKEEPLDYLKYVNPIARATLYIFQIGDSEGAHFTVETSMISELLFERHKEMICRTMLLVRQIFKVVDDLENTTYKALYTPKATHFTQQYSTYATLKSIVFYKPSFCACRVNILNTREIINVYGDKTLIQAKETVFRLIHTHSKDLGIKMQETIQYVENDGILVLFDNINQAKTILEKLEDLLTNTVIDSYVVTVKLGAALVQFPVISDTTRIGNLLTKGINYLSEHSSDIVNIVDMHSDEGERILNEYKLSEDLRQTITKKRDEIMVYYQPKVDANTGRVVGAEGLVRWNNSERGLVPPNEFIPISERTGIIKELGKLILDTVIGDSRKLEAELGMKIRLGVNVSALQLEDESFVDYVESKIESGDCDPTLIDLEVTESVGMFDINHSIELLGRLKKAGVTISLDDFGTGYSSLTYVKNLPLDCLKIDKSFVDSIFDETSFCQNIIDISKKINLSTVAEGVETKEQWDILREFGCDTLQGYYFSKPVTFNELIDKIKHLNKTEVV